MIETGRTRQFWDGVQYGIEQERGRVAEIIEFGTKTRDTILTFAEAIEANAFELPDGRKVVEQSSIYLAMAEQLAWYLQQIKDPKKNRDELLAQLIQGTAWAYIEDEGDQK